MPDIKEDQLLVIRRFKLPVGQNDNDEVSSLKVFEASVLQNVIVSSRGKRSTRPGYTLIADDLGSNAINGLHHFYPQSGTKVLLNAVGGSLYKYASGDTSWTSIASGLTAALRTRMVVGFGYALILNGTDNTRSFDGTTVADEGNTNTSCPRGKFGIYHQNKFIIGGDGTNKSYFWPSTTLTKTFDRSGVAFKVSDNDNGILMNLLNFSLTTNHGFLALKDNGIYFVDSHDTTVANWAIIQIDNHGLAATDAVAVVGSGNNGNGDVIYLSNDGASGGENKYRVRSLLRTVNDAILNGGVLSDSIQSTLNDLNASAIDKCCAIFFDNKFFLAFPSGSSTYNDKVAVLDLSVSSPGDNFWAWSIWSGMNVACWAVFEINGVKNLYFGEASADSKVYKALSGTSDNGTAIQLIESGRAEDFDFPEIDKVPQWVEPQFIATDNTVVTVKANVDQAGFSTIGTINVQSGAPVLPQTLPFNLSSAGKVKKKFQLEELGKGRDIQIRVEHSELDKTVEYLGYTLTAFPENVEMGDDTV